jgi:5S rRNA maturation endonuclease (ribonuclease M5)
MGPEQYDETTAAMIALLKYGSGMPFYRLEKLERLLGIPLPASTQWEIVEEAAEVIKAARDELIRQAAQGEVLHNDDTSMRVLRLAREPSDERTGVFTSGIVSTQQGRRIALYFTGRQHAGENLRDVLQHRVAELGAPIQMCDALSRNTISTSAPPHRFLPGAKGGLYSWQQVRHCPEVILVEGLFDYAVLWQAGFHNVTCSMGNHLNAHQYGQLCDGPRTIYLALDADTNGSGQQASQSLACRLTEQGMNVRRVSLPDGHDPNSFFVEDGDARKFQLLLEAALP